MINLGINQVCGFIQDFVDYILQPVYRIIGGVYEYSCRIIYVVYVLPLMTITDVCQLLFRKFAGLSSMSLEGESYSGDIILSFIQSQIVQNIFWAMLVLAVVILLISTFVAVIKTEFDVEGNNSKRKVVKMAFRGLANFLLVPIIAVFGIIISNALLKTIDGATNISGQQTSLSSQIFLAGAYNANRVRKGEDNSQNAGITHYIQGTFGALVVGAGDYENNHKASDGVSVTQNNSGGYANFGIFFDDSNGVNGSRAAEKIDSAFGSSLSIKDVKVASVNENQRRLNFNPWLDCIGDFYHYGVYYMYPNGLHYKTPSLTEGIIFVYDESITFSIYNVGLVNYYYDLSLTGFNYIVAIISIGFCAWTFTVTILGLIKRIFMIVTLFIISAPICATYPLNNGDMLKKWRTEFIKNTLSAYSVVVVMNLFLSLLPLFLNIQVFAPSDIESFGALTNGIKEIFSTKVGLLNTVSLSLLNADYVGEIANAAGSLVCGFLNYFARIFIVIGALTFFKDAIKVISEMIGAGDAYGDGSSKAKEFAANVSKVVAGVALTAAGGAGIAKLASGAVKGVAKGVKATKAFNGMNKAKNSIGENGGGENQSEQMLNGEQKSGKAEMQSSVSGNGNNSMIPENNKTSEMPIQNMNQQEKYKSYAKSDNSKRFISSAKGLFTQVQNLVSHGKVMGLGDIGDIFNTVQGKGTKKYRDDLNAKEKQAQKEQEEKMRHDEIVNTMRNQTNEVASQHQDQNYHFNYEHPEYLDRIEKEAREENAKEEKELEEKERQYKSELNAKNIAKAKENAEIANQIRTKKEKTEIVNKKANEIEEKIKSLRNNKKNK